MAFAIAAVVVVVVVVAILVDLSTFPQTIIAQPSELFCHFQEYFNAMPFYRFECNSLCQYAIVSAFKLAQHWKLYLYSSVKYFHILKAHHSPPRSPAHPRPFERYCCHWRCRRRRRRRSHRWKQNAMELTFLLYLPAPDTNSAQKKKTNVANARVWQARSQTHTLRIENSQIHIYILHATK